jgi:hypothetical protein
MKSDNQRKYHSALALVHAERWTFTLGEVWSAIDDAERRGFTLREIHRALTINRSATIVALVLRRTACLRAIIAEARP